MESTSRNPADVGAPGDRVSAVSASFHQSLETVTEPHRLTSTMNAVSAVLRTMTESGPRPEVVPLLQMVLPGIDPNDKLKTMCTFVLIDRLADMITFIDCSGDADNPELTEVTAATFSSSDALLCCLNVCLCIRLPYYYRILFTCFLLCVLLLGRLVFLV